MAVQVAPELIVKVRKLDKKGSLAKFPKRSSQGEKPMKPERAYFA